MKEISFLNLLFTRRLFSHGTGTLDSGAESIFLFLFFGIINACNDGSYDEDKYISVNCIILSTDEINSNCPLKLATIIVGGCTEICLIDRTIYQNNLEIHTQIFQPFYLNKENQLNCL